MLGDHRQIASATRRKRLELIQGARNEEDDHRAIALHEARESTFRLLTRPCSDASIARPRSVDLIGRVRNHWINRRDRRVVGRALAEHLGEAIDLLAHPLMKPSWHFTPPDFPLNVVRTSRHVIFYLSVSKDDVQPKKRVFKHRVTLWKTFLALRVFFRFSLFFPCTTALPL